MFRLVKQLFSVKNNGDIRGLKEPSVFKKLSSAIFSVLCENGELILQRSNGTQRRLGTVTEESRQHPPILLDSSGTVHERVAKCEKKRLPTYEVVAEVPQSTEEWKESLGVSAANVLPAGAKRQRTTR